MHNKVLSLAILFPAATAMLRADFSYEENARITGGMLAAAMKVASVFSKQAREPMRSTVAVKGDRLAHLSATHASIIDLSKETITSIDFQKKTWSVMTFAEMQQAMQRMSEKMKEKQNGDVKFKVSVNATGATKDINGMPSKEMQMKMEMEGTDQQSGQKGSFVVMNDMWLAPKVSGYEEITEFYKKMAQKLAWAPGQMGMMGRPDLAKGMAELNSEVSKLDGMPVYSTVRMGSEGMAPPQSSGPSAEQPKQQSQGPSGGSVLGGALGGRLGLGRKKSQPQEEQQQTGGGQGQASAVLIEMVSESSNFSAAPVDPSKFEVPAGFKLVQPETRMR